MKGVIIINDKQTQKVDEEASANDYDFNIIRIVFNF